MLTAGRGNAQKTRGQPASQADSSAVGIEHQQPTTIPIRATSRQAARSIKFRGALRCPLGRRAKCPVAVWAGCEAISWCAGVGVRRGRSPPRHLGGAAILRKNPRFRLVSPVSPLKTATSATVFLKKTGFLAEPFGGVPRISNRSRGQLGGDGRPARRRCVRHSLGEIQGVGARIFAGVKRQPAIGHRLEIA